MLLDPLRARDRRVGDPPVGEGVETRVGALGERAEVLGAAALVLAGAPRLLARRLGGA